MLLLFSISSYAIEVKKKRDRIRFGYGYVSECIYYLVGSDGSLTVSNVEMSCREPGSLNCRQGANNAAPPSGDLDVFTELTPAERTTGNNMIYNAEIAIESGQASGSDSQTITFISPSGQSYYRTFSITWSTNADESIDSIFNITDPVNN